MTQRWQKLGRDFRGVPDWHNQLEVSREQYQVGMPPGAWVLSGSLPERYRDQFEEIARAAGKELITDPAIGLPLPNEVNQEPDDLSRWFTAIQFLTDAYREPQLKWESDDSQTRFTINCGRIDSPLASSISLCRRLAAHELQLTAAKPDAAVPIRRKQPKHILQSPLHHAVKNAICDGLKGARLWRYVDLQAKVDGKIKPLPGWAEFWQSGFERAYKGDYRHKLDTLTTRVRKSLGHSSD